MCFPSPPKIIHDRITYCHTRALLTLFFTFLFLISLPSHDNSVVYNWVFYSQNTTVFHATLSLRIVRYRVCAPAVLYIIITYLGVVYPSHTAAHPRGKVSAGGAQADHVTTGHVLAPVVPHTLHHLHHHCIQDSMDIG